MKIKYSFEEYRVTFKSFIAIKIIKFRLILRRVKGWGRLVEASNLISFLLLTIIWLCGALLFAKVDQITLWEEIKVIKSEYFASVIIVGFVGLFAKVSRYRHINTDQQWIYEQLLHSLSDFFDPYFGEMRFHYIPLYCDKSFDQTLDYIHEKKIISDACELNSLIQQARADLDALNRLSMTRQLNISDYQLFDLCISDCKRCLHRISEPESLTEELMETLAQESYYLLEELRQLWRRDLDLDLKIMNIIISEGYSLMGDYYKRMLIYSYNEIEEAVMSETDTAI